MGLDAVELIMEIEQAFDIQIPDEPASNIRTVGELFDFLVTQIRGEAPSRDVCLSAAAFYLIRRAACDRLHLDRRHIRPSTRLESVVPVENRRAVWADLARSLHLRLPTLVRPSRIVWLASGLAILFALVMSVVVAFGFGPAGAVVCLLPALIVSSVTAAELTDSSRILFPPQCSTLRELAKYVLFHNYAAVSGQVNAWNPDDAWDALKQIIVDELGVRPELVTREASFVRDLGMS